ncbi:MAG: ATP-binding cassette domain-containing protein, partial [Actinobacteria bacterium]|nr:ATP-binding cassette domain-containing protein [Actinomycetota bacterium]
TVEENLEMGAFARHGRKSVQGDMAEVYTLFPVLFERRRQPAGSLSGGEQQMLALGRALMMKPKVVLFDEPSLGLAPIMVEAIGKIIGQLKESGLSILLVEQNANLALSLADRGYLMETGKIILEGTAAELRRDERVRKAYLGR